MPTIGQRLRHGWNAFRNRDPTAEEQFDPYQGYSWGHRPDRVRLRGGNEKSIIAAIYNRIAIDVASIRMEHVRTDQNGRYSETIRSGLNYALTTEANIDQASTAFVIDVVMSMLDEGTVAVVPVDTTTNPKISDSYNIQTLRTAKVIEWKPTAVRVELYNDQLGQTEQITLPKKMVAIIENPLYAVMNERNSVLRRLIQKLNLLDAIDDQSGSGKLDLILQLPYVIKSPQRKEQANRRRQDIEDQLTGTKYGIAYTDGTERITQLNRPAENNLMAQIQYLTSMLYSQLGLTENVFLGTADANELNNYWSRTIKPILVAITEEFARKYLTKTARTQNQTIMFFKGAFLLVPPEQLAELADKFTRNEILSPNEIRAEIGYKPATDPAADELRNRNLNQGGDQTAPEAPTDGADQ